MIRWRDVGWDMLFFNVSMKELLTPKIIKRCFLKRRFYVFFAGFFLSFVAFSSLAASRQEIPLRADAGGKRYDFMNFSKRPGVLNRAVTHVYSPALVYVPPTGKSNHTAVLIIPGGGFSYIMLDYEGTDVAQALSKKGYASFILAYRLPHGGDAALRDDAFSDVQRAIRLIRSRAKEFSVASDRIGVMGFSAGGYLAANLSNRFADRYGELSDAVDKVSARPDFAALIYPVVSLEKNFTHSGTQRALIGNTNDRSLIQRFSQEYLITNETPPTFIVHALDDRVASPQNAIRYFEALNKNKIKAELHLFQTGGHGFSVNKKENAPSDNWVALFTDWQSALK